MSNPEKRYTINSVARNFRARPQEIPGALGNGTITERIAVESIPLDTLTKEFVATHPAHVFTSELGIQRFSQPFLILTQRALSTYTGKYHEYMVGAVDSIDSSHPASPESFAIQELRDQESRSKTGIRQAGDLVSPILTTFPDFAGTVIHAVSTDIDIPLLTMENFPYQQFLTRLTDSRAVLSGFAVLARKEFDTVHAEALSHLDQFVNRTQNGAVEVDWSKMPDHTGGRGCPMNTFGTMNVAYKGFTNLLSHLAKEQEAYYQLKQEGVFTPTPEQIQEKTSS